MPPFRFRLARALEWYGEQCRLEEDRLHARAAALGLSRAEFARARETRLAVEHDLLKATILPAGELLALARYRRRAIQQEQSLTEELVRSEREWEAQLLVVREARRRVRLIEKIRDRKLLEYTAVADREVEELAADAFRAVHSTSRAPLS